MSIGYVSRLTVKGTACLLWLFNHHFKTRPPIDQVRGVALCGTEDAALVLAGRDVADPRAGE